MKRKAHARNSGAAPAVQQEQQEVPEADMELGMAEPAADVSNHQPAGSDPEAPSSDADAEADLDGDADPDVEEDLDEDADADSEPSSSGREDLSASDADEGDVSSGDEQGGRSSKGTAGFLSGGKAASFSKAFAKIMGQPIAAATTKAAAAAAAGGEAGPGPASLAAAAAAALGSHPGDMGDVILAESASLAKRKVEVAEEAAARKEAKRHRLELKTRGHQAVPRKGEDPAHDAREKQLQRLATKGVVLLFNAINKAQKAAAEAEAARRKGPKISKAGLLAELKAGQKALLGGPAGAGTALPGAMGLVPQRKQQQADHHHQQQQQQQQDREVDSEEQEEEGPGAAGWEVLRAGFPGLTSGTKMKDWDKQMEEEEERVAEEVAGSEEEDDDGW